MNYISYAIFAALLPFLRRHEEQLVVDLEEARKGNLPAQRAREAYASSGWGWLILAGLTLLASSPLILWVKSLWVSIPVLILASLAGGEAIMAAVSAMHARRIAGRRPSGGTYTPIPFYRTLVLVIGGGISAFYIYGMLRAR